MFAVSIDMFRIDPIKEDGSIDVDFFGSYDYVAHRKAVETYLELEGFAEIEIKECFVITLNNRFWKIS